MIMQNSFRKLTVVLFLTSLFCMLHAANMAVAEDRAGSFHREAYYDIYYEVSRFEVDCIENVKISGTVTVAGAAFLAVIYSDISSQDGSILRNSTGYILLASVKAILPAEAVSPIRTFGATKY